MGITESGLSLYCLFLYFNWTYLPIKITYQILGCNPKSVFYKMEVTMPQLSALFIAMSAIGFDLIYTGDTFSKGGGVGGGHSIAPGETK